MNHSILLNLATAGVPPFGNQWLALLVIVVGVAIVLGLMALFARMIAYVPEVETPRVTLATNASDQSMLSSSVPNDVHVAIVAAVACTLGSKARVTGVSQSKFDSDPNFDIVMTPWAMEGRRMIYSSKKVR